MLSADLVHQFRLDVVDVVEPQLWTDAEAFEYLNDAQQMFCRLTGGIADASSALTLVDFTAGSDTVDTSPLILKVRDAYYLNGGAPIEVINYEDMTGLKIRFDGRTGVPKFFIIGMEVAKARLYPFPSVSDRIQLLVDRLPLQPITDTGLDVLEVQPQHRNGLIYWMKARAYSKQDAETFDKTKAADFEAKFRNYCAESKKEKDRAKHKTRVVEYGGI